MNVQFVAAGGSRIKKNQKQNLATLPNACRKKEGLKQNILLKKANTAGLAHFSTREGTLDPLLLALQAARARFKPTMSFSKVCMWKVVCPA